MMGRRWFHLLLVAWVLSFGGCASFDREWKNAAHNSGAKRDPFSGRWDGQWTSEKHRLPSGEPAGGRLRCLFTRVDDTHYRAQFHANWLCFATGYEVTFEAKRRGGVLAFRGEHDLGAIFGGVYRYKGLVTPQHFAASFASRYDYGRFDLHRPAREPLERPGATAVSR